MADAPREEHSWDRPDLPELYSHILYIKADTWG